VADRLRQLQDLATALEAVVADGTLPRPASCGSAPARLRQDWTAAADSLGDAPEAARDAPRAAARPTRRWRRATTGGASTAPPSRRAAPEELAAIQRLGELARVENATSVAGSRDRRRHCRRDGPRSVAAGPAAADEIMARLRAARADLQPKAVGLREADDWQRWRTRTCRSA